MGGALATGPRPIGYRRSVRRVNWMLAALVALGVVIGDASWSLAGTSTGHGAGPGSRARYELLLVPPIEGGLVGWCMTYQSPHSSGGKCPVIPTPRRPILAESWGFTSPPPITEAVALTTGQVAAVSVRGGPSSVGTRAEVGLPYGLRAAFVEIPGQPRPGADHLPITALDASGQPIRQLEPPATPPGYELESKFWKRPARAPRGACQISAASLPGLEAEWGHMVLRLRSLTGILGRPFLSCADTEYYLDNWPLDAGVVLDATHPGAEPAPLPNMTPVPAHPGVFQALGWNGKLVGRRSAGAWLLVEGGSDLQQRVTLLAHLRATLHT